MTKSKFTYLFIFLIFLPSLGFSTPPEACARKGGEYAEGNKPGSGRCWCSYGETRDRILIDPHVSFCSPPSHRELPKRHTEPGAIRPGMNTFVPISGFHWISNEEEQRIQEKAKGSQRVFRRPRVYIYAIFPFGGLVTGDTPLEIHFNLFSSAQHRRTKKVLRVPYPLPDIVRNPAQYVDVYFQDKNGITNGVVTRLMRSTMFNSVHLKNFMHSSWDNCSSGKYILLVKTPKHAPGAVDVLVNFKTIPFAGEVRGGYRFVLPRQMGSALVPHLSVDDERPALELQPIAPSFLEKICDPDAEFDAEMMDNDFEQFLHDGYSDQRKPIPITTPVLQRVDGKPVKALAPHIRDLLLHKHQLEDSSFPKQVVSWNREPYQVILPGSPSENELVLAHIICSCFPPQTGATSVPFAVGPIPVPVTLGPNGYVVELNLPLYPRPMAVVLILSKGSEILSRGSERIGAAAYGFCAPHFIPQPPASRRGPDPRCPFITFPDGLFSQ